MPGLKTKPLVKPFIAMKKKDLRNWEINLGLLQVAVVIGIFAVCLLAAFAFGLRTGKRSGFDAALSTSISQSPRISIARDSVEVETSPEEISKIYAKLRNPVNEGVGIEKEEDAAVIPEFSRIQTTEDSPVLEDLSDNLLGSRKESSQAASELEEETSPLARDSRETEGTLGALIRETKTEREAGDTKIPEGLPEKKKIVSEVKKEVQEPMAALSTDQTLTEVSAKQEKPVLPPRQKEESIARSSGMTADLPLETVKEKVPQKLKTSSAVKREESIEKKESEVSPVRTRNAIPQGWYAQVSAPRTFQDAQSLTSQLKRSGFRAYIEKANVRGQSYFRVLVGPEDNRQQVERLRQQLSRERFIRGQPFIRHLR